MADTAGDRRGSGGSGRAKTATKEVLAGVREWTEMAEDLITLQVLRHLSQFLAQLWVMVGFIVIGSLCLLLAVNSYPFPLAKPHGVLPGDSHRACAAFAILRLVIGINRDETISRVANTMSGLKLDRDLASGLVGYILPAARHPCGRVLRYLGPAAQLARPDLPRPEVTRARARAIRPALPEGETRSANRG